MQGLADGYFVLPYTIADYLSADIRTGKIPTNSSEFEAAEKVTINERGILVVAKISRLFSFFIKK